MLRTLSLLSGLFVIFSLGFILYGGSLNAKIVENNKLIAQNDEMIKNLQQLVLHSASENEGEDIDIYKNKSFAGYEEVVPFVPYLEKLLIEADPTAEVAIRSDEDQIFLNHYADYKVNIKVEDKEVLYEALNELYKSRFVVKIMNLTMHYKPATENMKNIFSDLEFTIRLYLK